MNSNRKKRTIKYNLCAISTILTLICIRSGICFAESGIGTAEVQTATENIKRVIVSIAMPLRWSSYIR